MQLPVKTEKIRLSPIGEYKVVCRNAAAEDVEELYSLIEEYARLGIMLPRSREALISRIDQFVIAEMDDNFIGCGSLFKLSPDLLEVRSIGLYVEGKGKGIGSMILAKLIEAARGQRIPQVIAFTCEVDFFLRNGFTVVEKSLFPEKVKSDCVNCKRQLACNEIAVVKRIDEFE